MHSVSHKISLGVQQPTSHGACPELTQAIFDLWWTQWHGNSFLSK